MNRPSPFPPEVRISLFDHSHPLWETFVDFHMGRLTGEARRKAKSLLFGIHYGSYDTRRAFKLIETMKKEGKA